VDDAELASHRWAWTPPLPFTGIALAAYPDIRTYLPASPSTPPIARRSPGPNRIGLDGLSPMD
jgi:hypothetical protein